MVHADDDDPLPLRVKGRLGQHIDMKMTLYLGYNMRAAANSTHAHRESINMSINSPPPPPMNQWTVPLEWNGILDL